jgi:hypothetical protein
MSDGVILEVQFTKVCFKGKITVKFKAQPTMSHNFSTVQNGRKSTPQDQLVTSQFVCGTA